MSRFGIVLGITAMVAVLASAAAEAQSLSGIAGQLLGGGQQTGTQSSGAASSGSLAGAAESLMGQALPGVSSAGTDNITGVLSYCVQNNLVSNSGAGSLLSSLTGRGGMTSSSGFLAGQSGNLQTGNGNMFSLSGLTDELKSKLCSMVMQRAQSLL